MFVTVAPGRSAPLRTLDDFERRFDDLAERRQAQISNIDQLENPLGDNHHFLSVYRGPLLAPVAGRYVFATNSDDGSFVRVNGVLVASRPGPNNMEIVNSPARNTWGSRGTIVLKQGLHWVEYFHQQGGGATLARLGWQPPLPDTANTRLIGIPGNVPEQASVDVVPAWALDGIMPCAVEIVRNGKPQLTLLPTLGLELRLPRTRIPALRWTTPDREHYHYVAAEGRHGLQGAEAWIPVWAWSAHHRAFSLEWETRVPPAGAPALRTLLYDIELPLTVQVGSRPPDGTRRHAPRAWKTWTLSDADAASAFVISFEGVTLLSDRLPAWPAEPSPPGIPVRKLAIGNLIEASLLRPERAFAGRAFAAVWRGTPPDRVVPGWRRADPWAGDPEAFRRQLGEIPPRTGVILRFDQRTRLLGLTDRQLTLRLHAAMRAVREAGAEPVLVLDAEIDVRQPSVRSAAMAFHRLSRTFACPFVDLRESTP